jgi:NAD-dependent dihydropyrimidine dehydrogenase PreA subunit
VGDRRGDRRIREEMQALLYLKDVVTLVLDAEKCTGCRMCLAVCPRDVFRPLNGKVEIASRDSCIECGACRRNCPSGALNVRAGVGCASGMINKMLGRKNACGVVDDDCGPCRH